MSKCRDCGCTVDWLTNEYTGKKMPINREEVPFVYSEDCKIRAVIDGEIIRGYQVGDANEGGYELAHMVHWDVCEGGK